MAEAHKFKTVEEARKVFPDLVVRTNRSAKTVAIKNEKTGEYAPVEEGQYIVKIADRYEVHDEAPDNAKPADEPKAAKKSESPKKESRNSEETPKAVKGNTTVVPEELATPPGPESE